jgi:hypothetical protein
MAKSAHYLRYVCLSISARQHWTDFRAIYFPGLLQKKICRDIPSFFKIEQNIGQFTFLLLTAVRNIL